MPPITERGAQSQHEVVRRPDETYAGLLGYGWWSMTKRESDEKCKRILG
jgi:hypothetical protein